MKHIFLIGIILVVLLVGTGTWWLIKNYLNAECIQSVAQRNRVLAVLIALLPLAACCYFFKYNMPTVLIVVLHLFIISVFSKLLFLISGKLLHFSFRNDLCLGIGILLTGIVLLLGWHNMHSVRKTEYTVYTDKKIPSSGIRVALISDAHLSTCLTGEDFSELIEQISFEKPDLFLICGDLVDESSKIKDLNLACASIKSKLEKQNVLMIYGNHDIGIYGRREIGKDLLQNELINANVTILEDESFSSEGIVLIGRADASSKGRKIPHELMSDISSDTFTIVIDHQPNDYQNESLEQIDLVVSGHTHGGQIFPAGLVGLITGANDRCYGTEVRNGTAFIVSSGISGWAIPFKTGTFSEYVIINIAHKEG